jgi:predicted RNase H-like HicB family nuclease
MKYVAIIEPTNKGFSAYSPDIPGYIAKGATEENAKEALKEAITYHIERLREVGLEIPRSYCRAETIDIVT